MLAAALKEPRNQRFLLLSESCAPLYPPAVVYQQARLKSPVPLRQSGAQGLRESRCSQAYLVSAVCVSHQRVSQLQCLAATTCRRQGTRASCV